MELIHLELAKFHDQLMCKLLLRNVYEIRAGMLRNNGSLAVVVVVVVLVLLVVVLRVFVVEMLVLDVVGVPRM